ncbi:hypothetical protein D3C87_966960 [compost metagenome]
MKRIQIWMGMAFLAIAGCGTPSLMPQGKPPAIQNVMAESDDVVVGAGIRLKALASSETGGLTYDWLADRGMIARPDEATTLWLAPPSVPYTPYPVTISVTVKDKYGRPAKASYQIRVHQQGNTPL